jgi:hypothetical protein
MIKSNKDALIEQIDIDYQNSRKINKTLIDSLNLLIKKIDNKLIAINDNLSQICQINKLTYKVGIYMKNPKKFIIWYGFNESSKKWKFATRNYQSITTTVRQNIVFNLTSDSILDLLRLANDLMLLRQKLIIDNKLMVLLNHGKKRFGELMDERT